MLDFILAKMSLPLSCIMLFYFIYTSHGHQAIFKLLFFLLNHLDEACFILLHMTYFEVILLFLRSILILFVIIKSTKEIPVVSSIVELYVGLHI